MFYESRVQDAVYGADHLLFLQTDMRASSRNRVFTDTLEPDDLRQLLWDTRRVLELQPDGQSVEQHVQHELEHLRAAKMVGSVAKGFGVRITALDVGDEAAPTYSYNPFFLHDPSELPSLAAAAIIGHPNVPSRYDIKDLKEQFGFATVRALGNRTAEHNCISSAAEAIPLPLSYAPRLHLRKLLPGN